MGPFWISAKNAFIGITSEFSMHFHTVCTRNFEGLYERHQQQTQHMLCTAVYTKCTTDSNKFSLSLDKNNPNFNADEVIDSSELEVYEWQMCKQCLSLSVYFTMVHIEAITIIAVVGSAFLSDIICIILLMVLILDPYSMAQGLDYCLFSLILSDLLENIVLGSMSICSSVLEHWVFGENACKLFAYASYALWLVNIMSLFWLSVDRYLFITDIKYSTYKMRMKARFICKIILSWFVSVIYSFAPIVANKNTGRYLKQSFVCILNTRHLESYYATVTILVILPCFIGTNFNFARIFFMRFKYKKQRYCQTKLSETDVETLMDPNHKMSAWLALIFWATWLPYITYHFAWENTNDDEPTLFEYWIGKCGTVLRLPILTMCFPRYRNYLRSFFGSVKRNSTPLHFRRFQQRLSLDTASHPQQLTLPDDYSLHM